MKKQLTPEMKRDIEAGFVFRQEMASRRRATTKRLFLVGIVAGVAAGLLRGVEVRSWLVVLLNVTWLLSTVAYVGGNIVPLSIKNDIDPRWHMNPWRDALRNLGEERCIKEAIMLLAGPVLVRMIVNFAYVALR